MATGRTLAVQVCSTALTKSEPPPQRYPRSLTAIERTPCSEDPHES
jgi:hypothetical protein